MVKRIFSFMVICLVVVVSPLLGCSSVPDEFTRSRNMWQDKNIRDYSFVLELRMFIMDIGNPVRIEVRDGVPQEYIAVNEPNNFERSWIFGGYDTLDKLLQKIEGAYKEKADIINVTYDAEYGFPAYAEVDPDREAMDEQWGFTVSEFTVIRS